MNQAVEISAHAAMQQHFLGAWWLPPALNEFATYGIRIAAIYPRGHVPALGGRWSHERHTGPAVHHALPAGTLFLGMPVGCSGMAICGVGSYLRQHIPQLKIVAGFPFPGPAQGRMGSWTETVIRAIPISIEGLDYGVHQLAAQDAPWKAGRMSVIAWKALGEYLWSLPPRFLIGMAGKSVSFLCLERLT